MQKVRQGAFRRRVPPLFRRAHGYLTSCKKYARERFRRRKPHCSGHPDTMSGGGKALTSNYHAKVTIHELLRFLVLLVKKQDVSTSHLLLPFSYRIDRKHSRANFNDCTLSLNDMVQMVTGSLQSCSYIRSSQGQASSQPSSGSATKRALSRGIAGVFGAPIFIVSCYYAQLICQVRASTKVRLGA